MEFAFTAIDAAGGQVKEQIRCDSESQAVQRLQSQGYIILSLEAAGGRGRKAKASQKEKDSASAGSAGSGLNKSIPLPWKRKLKLDQLTLLTREFAIMIETGVPIVEAIELLREHADNAILQDALAGVHTDLCAGRTLVQALSVYPNVFPKLYVDMVRTAETGGALDETLNQAADYQELALEMRRKIVGALTYPAILGIVAVMVVLFMLIFLLPQFKDMFSKMGAEIPLQTQILLAASDFLHANWWVVPLTVFGAVASFKAVLRVPAGKRALTQNHPQNADFRRHREKSDSGPDASRFRDAFRRWRISADCIGNRAADGAGHDF